MNAEFNVWLLIVGLVVGAGLAWLVMMDSRRREAEIDATELPREAAWLSAVMAEDGYEVSPDAAEQLLLLHRAYLGAPPPDPFVEDEPGDVDPSEPDLADGETAEEETRGDQRAPGEDVPTDIQADEGDRRG